MLPGPRGLTWDLHVRTACGTGTVQYPVLILKAVHTLPRDNRSAHHERLQAAGRVVCHTTADAASLDCGYRAAH